MEDRVLVLESECGDQRCLICLSADTNEQDEPIRTEAQEFRPIPARKPSGARPTTRSGYLKQRQSGIQPQSYSIF